MVKTDGGSNMVANTFLNNIPGWDQGQADSSEEREGDSDPIETLDSEDADMVEIELNASDDDPVWAILQDNGLDLSQIAVLDDEEQQEQAEVETGLQQAMPSSSSIEIPTDGYKIEAAFRLYSAQIESRHTGRPEIAEGNFHPQVLRQLFVDSRHC